MTVCAQCGNEFTPRRPGTGQRFCKLECVGLSQRKPPHVCVDCGVPCKSTSRRCKRCHDAAVRAGKIERKPRRKQVRPSGWHRSGPPWSQSLTPEQTDAIVRIRDEHNGGRRSSGSHGWTVYMVPSILPARYVKLRHHMLDSRVARWVIEKDGSVSADNDRGRLPSLHPVAA